MRFTDYSHWWFEIVPFSSMTRVLDKEMVICLKWGH